MIRRPPRSTLSSSSAASDVYKRQIYIYDLVETRNIYTNREVTEFLGYTSEEILAFGSALFEHILHPDDAALVAEHHARLHRLAPSDDCVLEVDYRMKRASGEWRWRASYGSRPPARSRHSGRAYGDARGALRRARRHRDAGCARRGPTRRRGSPPRYSRGTR